MYETKEAKLNGIAGEGYAYVVDTFQGKVYRGVFFASEEAHLDEVAGKEEVVPFEGTVYHKTVERIEELDVNVTKTVGVSIGTRADFEVVEEG